MPDPRYTLHQSAGVLGLPESTVRYHRDLFERWLPAAVHHPITATVLE